MNAKDLLARIAEQKAQCSALKELWQLLLQEFPAPDDRQWCIWLTKHTFDEIVKALDITAQRYTFLLQKGTSPFDTPTRIIRYVSGILINMNIDKLDDDGKKDYISKVRSEAGKRGARGRWKKEISEAKETKVVDGKTEDCAVCHPLPCTCHPLVIACHLCGSGSGCDCVCESDRQNRSGSYSESSSSVEDKERLVFPQNKNEDPEPEPKPEPTAKTKPYPAGFDSWSNASRLAWLEAHKQNGTGNAAVASGDPRYSTKNKNEGQEQPPDRCRNGCSANIMIHEDSGLCVMCYEDSLNPARLS